MNQTETIQAPPFNLVDTWTELDIIKQEAAWLRRLTAFASASGGTPRENTARALQRFALKMAARDWCGSVLVVAANIIDFGAAHVIAGLREEFPEYDDHADTVSAIAVMIEHGIMPSFA